MTLSRVAEALALIPQGKAQLDAEDDLLRSTIRHVETVLNELRPGVTTSYEYTTNGVTRLLEFEPANRRWIIAWVTEDEDIPLLSAPREMRAEVFFPLESGLSPIEHLIIKIAQTLQTEGSARSALLDVAKRLTATLTKAGFPPSEGSR